VLPGVVWVRKGENDEEDETHAKTRTHSTPSRHSPVQLALQCPFDRAHPFERWRALRRLRARVVSAGRLRPGVCTGSGALSVGLFV